MSTPVPGEVRGPVPMRVPCSNASRRRRADGDAFWADPQGRRPVDVIGEVMSKTGPVVVDVMVLAFVTPIMTLSVPVMSSVPVRLNFAIGGLTTIAPPSRVTPVAAKNLRCDIPYKDFSPPPPCVRLALMVIVSAPIGIGDRSDATEVERLKSGTRHSASEVDVHVVEVRTCERACAVVGIEQIAGS